MGDFPSVHLLPTLLVAVVLISNACTKDECEHICFQRLFENSTASIYCKRLNETGCSNVEEVSRSRSAGKHGMLGDIHLQKLEVIEQPSSPTSSQFALKFTWNLPQDDGSKTEGFLVKISGNSPNASSICILYDYQHSMDETSSQTSLNVSFSTCYRHVSASLVYDVRVQYAHHWDAASYVVTMPPNLLHAVAPPTPDLWTPPIAICTRPQSVDVLFQAAPAQLNFSSYSLALIEPKYSRQLRTTIMNDTSTSFQSVPSGVTYIVQVTPQGDCGEKNCTTMRSAPFTLTDDSQPATVLPTGYMEGGSSLMTTTDSSSVMTTADSSSVMTTADSTDKIHDTTTGVNESNTLVTPEGDSHRGVFIVLGSIAAATAVTIVIVVLVCFRGRVIKLITRVVLRLSGMSQNEIEKMLMTDLPLTPDPSPTQPRVLILYSYDCAAHERVIVEFASHLCHTLACEVALDIWQQADVTGGGGAMAWLDRKLAWCTRVVVVCSPGARVKCRRRRRHAAMRMTERRPVPDVFVAAVGHTLQWLRGGASTRLAVAYFDYCRRSDVPPCLERGGRAYRLPRDLPDLQRLLQVARPDHYLNSETGAQLDDALADAHSYFHDHPDWLDNTLQAPHARSASWPARLGRRHRRYSPLEAAGSERESPAPSGQLPRWPRDGGDVKLLPASDKLVTSDESSSDHDSDAGQLQRDVDSMHELSWRQAMPVARRAESVLSEATPTRRQATPTLRQVTPTLRQATPTLRQAPQGHNNNIDKSEEVDLSAIDFSERAYSLKVPEPHVAACIV